MNENNILIVGAGQLGSRYLQGMASLKKNCSIYIIDPSDLSLKRAKERFEEMEYNNKVYYRKEYVNLPNLRINLQNFPLI